MQKDIFLGIGSNLGDRMKNLETACRYISELKGVNLVSCSEVLETEPWGKKDQPYFLNAAVQVECGLSPSELLQHLLDIELKMGRERNIKWGPRSIDIDILFFGDRLIREEKLIIPHEGIQNRRFVLENLCDLAPEFIHPVLHKSLQTLLDEFMESERISKFGKLTI
ncbi:MAG TPA: 2-amino-4-hydroxy-6-hydroxymethyldihydropteridine diphosphokinase [Bacteroidia bacterium]|jgi:2-amino-4-hydroxy-6-hydroxymethyldihydropteridine diphosphokinase|nr:2-amino-4-hydroxy-6-hydroxymethyldihydropteridine diphosphokinase [Bacteroidia bacterium]